VIQTCDTVQRRSINDREVQLLVSRVEVNEQVEYLVNNPVRTRARTVNFVDNYDWLQTVGKCFLVTKRVCGIGPSIASTTSRTESTMDITRSTSPPKSACPGVSTMLIR
jgi:hypothetical protein